MSPCRHLLFLLSALVLVPVPALAAPVADLSPADTQDVILFAGHRPVRLRLHLLVEGKPFSARWNDFLTRLFAHLDRNEDGVLDQTEMARAPSAPELRQCLNGNPFIFRAQGTRVEGMDTNDDGFVSLDEFVRYYRSQAGPIQGTPYYINGIGPDNLSERLFELLDTNKDQHLSREELAAAPSVLGAFDMDDDETISGPELLTGSSIAIRPPPGRGPRLAPQPPTLLLIENDPSARKMKEPLRIAQEILQRLDLDRDQKLSRKEITLPRTTFDLLDRNHDGQLDALELLRWSALPPEAEVVLRLTADPKARATVEIVALEGAKELPASGAAIEPSLALAIEGLRLTVVGAPAMMGNAQGYRSYFQQQLAALDKEKNGYVTRKQLEGPNGQYLRFVLELVDRDNSGRLSLKQIDAWLELMSHAATCSVTLTLVPSGNSLFRTLDANSDGRLSVRELRNSWTHVARHVASGSPGLGRDDLPQQYRLVANAGGPNYAFTQAFNQGARGPRMTGPAAGGGPLWFRKMDRNRDGDVSRREFLGTAEQFRQLDLDGDGLISLPEALQAGGRLSKSKTGR